MVTDILNVFNIFDCTRIQPNVSSVFKLKIMHLKYFQSNHYRIGQSTTSLLFIKSREHLTLAWSSSPSPRAPWCGSHHATSAAPSFGVSFSRASNILILLPSTPHIALDTPYDFYLLLDRGHLRRYILQVFICFLSSETSSPLALCSWRRLQAPSCDDLQLWRCLTCLRRGQGCPRQPIG